MIKVTEEIKESLKGTKVAYLSTAGTRRISSAAKK